MVYGTEVLSVAPTTKEIAPSAVSFDAKPSWKRARSGSILYPVYDHRLPMKIQIPNCNPDSCPCRELSVFSSPDPQVLASKFGTGRVLAAQTFGSGNHHNQDTPHIPPKCLSRYPTPPMPASSSKATKSTLWHNPAITVNTQLTTPQQLRRRRWSRHPQH